MLGKKIASGFVIFLIVTLIIFVQLLQSAKFADFVKLEIKRHISPVIRADIEFSRMKVSFFPPGMSMTDVLINPMDGSSPLGMKSGSRFHADSVGVTFPMLQAFGSGISINKLFISGAKVDLSFQDSAAAKDPKDSGWFKRFAKTVRIQITNNFSLNIQQLELRDSSLELEIENGKDVSQVSIRHIDQINVRPENGLISLLLNVDDLYFRNKNEGLVIDALRTNVEVSAKEIQIHTLDLQRGEMAANAQGKLKGNVDNIDALNADVRAIFRARAESLSEFTTAAVGVGGLLEANLHISGALKDYLVNGAVKAKKLTYSDWAFDELNLSGTLSPRQFELEKAELKLEEQSLTLGSFSFPLEGMPAEQTLTVGFNRVDFHKFSGDLRKSINNLEATLDGKMNVKLFFQKDKAHKTSLDAVSLHTDLSVQNFSLNNQVYGKIRKKRDILKLRTAKLGGEFFYKAKVLEARDATITLPSGKADVTGDVSNGVFNLTAKSSVIDWGQDLGEISEIPFQGKGTVGVHVRGPAEALFIDFDANLNDCRFIDLQFGELSGQATLDDDRSLLIIKKAVGVKNLSQYSVEGEVHLDDSNGINLKAQFPDAHPNDVLEIFKHQLSGISWTPWGIAGNISGTATLGGDYGKTENLLVRAQVHAEKLQYAGEFVHEMDAEVGFEKGAYHVRGLKARKYNSIITGNLVYDKDHELHYDASVGQGKIRDLDYLAIRGFPLDALLVLQSRGNGSWDKLQSITNLELSGAHLQTRALPNLKLQLDTGGPGWTLKGQTLPEQMDFQLKINDASSRSSLDFNIEPSDLGFLFCAYNRVLCADPTANLMFAAKGKLEWGGENWRQASGDIDVSRVSIAKSGFGLAPESPIKLTWNRGDWISTPFELQGPVSKIHSSLSGSLVKNQVSAAFRGEASMRLLEFLTPVISEAQGRIKIDTKIAKTGESSSFQGNIGFSGGLLRLKGLDATAENINGALTLAGNHLEIKQITGNLGGGTMEILGGANISFERPPELNFQLSGKDNRLKFFPLSYAEVEEARLSVTGERPPYLFGGNVKVRSALMRRNFEMGQQQKSLQSSRYLPEIVSGDTGLYQVKIKATADNGILVQNDLLDGEFRGEVTLLNNFEFPQIIGKAELVQGKLNFRSTSFNLDHAVVRLPSPEIFRPQFSVGGTTTVNNYKISMFASGTPENPQISFSSSPALPQSEILSLLAFGFKGEDTKSVKQNDMSAITYSEVGSILLEQLRINKDLQSKGFKVNVVPSVNDNEANIVRPRSAADTASPKIVLQSQVAKDLDAVLGATLGASQSQELSGSLEYRLGRRASVSGVFEQEQAADASETQSSYGADLKFRWGFK